MKEHGHAAGCGFDSALPGSGVVGAELHHIACENRRMRPKGAQHCPLAARLFEHRIAEFGIDIA